MSAGLWLFRNFYEIQVSASTATTYTSIDVDSISASTSISGSTIEVSLPIVNYAVGAYYCIIDDSLYDRDVIYDLEWVVRYTSSSPIRSLPTRFKLYDGIGNGVVVREILYELKKPMPMTVIINKRPLDYEVNHQ
jgi:hypothetical protein